MNEQPKKYYCDNDTCIFCEALKIAVECCCHGDIVERIKNRNFLLSTLGYTPLNRELIDHLIKYRNQEIREEINGKTN
jgi:hypothetical protein